MLKSIPPKTQDSSLTRLCLSLREVCDLTGLSRSTLYKLVRSEKLKVLKVGTRVLIPHKELDAYLENLRPGRTK